MNEKDIQNLSIQTADKTNNTLTQVSHDYNDNNIHEWKYKSVYKNQEYIFVLVEESKNNKPFYCIENGERYFIINYDYDHPIWSPSNNKNSGLSNRVLSHPIIVTLALAQWLIGENNKNSLTSSNYKFDLFNIIDEIIACWKSEKNE